MLQVSGGARCPGGRGEEGPSGRASKDGRNVSIKDCKNTRLCGGASRGSKQGGKWGQGLRQLWAGWHETGSWGGWQGDSGGGAKGLGHQMEESGDFIPGFF